MPWARHRLRTGDDFRAVTRQGTRSARSHVVVHLALSPERGPEPRVGFVVSRKIGNAVVRNRVTRRLREIFRARMTDLPAGCDVVIRALPGIEQLPFGELEEQVDAAISAALRKHERRARPGGER